MKNKQCKRLCFLFLTLSLVCALSACGRNQTSDSNKILTWQDLKTADKIELHEVEAKYLSGDYYERADIYSSLSELPVQDHLAFFTAEEYEIEGKYLKQVGYTADNQAFTEYTQIECSLPPDLDYQLQINDNYTMRRLHYTSDIKKEDPEYAEKYSLDLTCEQDQICIVNNNNQDDIMTFLPLSTVIAKDDYMYVYQGNNNCYLISEDIYYQEDKTVSRVFLYDLNLLNGAESNFFDSWIGTIAMEHTNDFQWKILLSTNNSFQTLYDDSYSENDILYSSVTEAQTRINDYLNDLGITRKIFRFQTDKEQESDRVTPIIASQWLADQEIYDAFHNAATPSSSIVEEFPAKGHLLFAYQSFGLGTEQNEVTGTDEDTNEAIPNDNEQMSYGAEEGTIAYKEEPMMNEGESGQASRYARIDSNATIDETGPCGPSTFWTLYSNGVLEISGSGTMDGYETFAWAPWHDKRFSVRTVIVREGVTNIGLGSFADFGNVEEVILPSSIRDIDGYAFHANTKLQSIVIPEGVISIGKEAFSSCIDLANIELPNSLTRIGDHAFRSCNFNRIKIPSNVSEIGREALNSSVIIVDKNNASYSSEDGVLFDKNKTILISYPSRRDNGIYTIPSSVKTIDFGAFSFYQQPEIRIPNSITSIGANAFLGSNLTKLVIPAGVQTLDYQAFGACDNLKLVYIPKSMLRMGNMDVFGAFAGCSLSDVYYEGNENQWKTLMENSKYDQDVLESANVHYNSSIPN